MVAASPVEVRSGHLRRRLTGALIALTVAAATILSTFVWVTERWIERGSVETLMERELDYLIRIGAQPSTRDIVASGEDLEPALLYYRPAWGGNVPAPLRVLNTGWHRDVEIGSGSFQILIRDLAPEDRVYLMHDISPLEARDQRLVGSFGLGLALVSLLAIWGAHRVADEALAPLARLVAQIRGLDPENGSARLKPEDDPELDVIAEALNGYMAELDALVEREHAFAAAASHELRTPLAVIRGAAELLDARPADPARPLARIQRAVAQAQEDLDALLALSRLRESPLAWSLPLDRLLPEWSEMDAGSTRLVWHLEPTELNAAAGSVHVIFSNLLRNAVRAAGPDGEVIIELDQQALKVIDNGPGIPAHELPLVFEPHFRGRDGGTGIGLYVARAMARRHGWQLGLDNRAGGGAIATLSFSAPPRRPLPAASA